MNPSLLGSPAPPLTLRCATNVFSGSRLQLSMLLLLLPLPLPLRLCWEQLWCPPALYAGALRRFV